MKSLFQSTWPLFFGITLIMIGNGLQGTLLGVRAEIEGFDTATTGLIMSLYYGGYLAGSILAPKLVSNVGHIRVFTALASLASTTALFHGLFADPVVWAISRIIAGFSFAGLYIVVESWFNALSTNENRGKILGAYMLTFYGAMVAGQYLLNLAPAEKIELFILISILISIALVPISLSKRPAPDFEAPTPTGPKSVYKASPLGTIGVIISGTASGIIFALAPVYAIQMDLETAQIANFMALFVMGGMLAQLPLGLISDKVGRRKLIMGASLLAGAAAGACYLVSDDIELLYIAFFVLGMPALSIYGLCVAYTNDYLDNDQYVGASATLILLGGCGAFAGPFIASMIMQAFGTEALFLMLGFIYSAILTVGIQRAIVRDQVPIEEQAHFISVPPRATPIAAQIAEETDESEAENT